MTVATPLGKEETLAVSAALKAVRLAGFEEEREGENHGGRFCSSKWLSHAAKNAPCSLAASAARGGCLLPISRSKMPRDIGIVKPEDAGVCRRYL